MLIKRNINPEVPPGNKIRIIRPEELVTKLKVELVYFITQAYNIDVIRPQL